LKPALHVKIGLSEVQRGVVAPGRETKIEVVGPRSADGSANLEELISKTAIAAQVFEGNDIPHGA
jgi:hypothetical protein